MKYACLVLAACAAQPSPTAARYDRCDGITVHAAADDADVEKAILVQRCTEDEWSEDAIRCFSVAATKPVFDGCYGKLSDHGDKLRAELNQSLGGAALAKLVEVKAEMCACKPGSGGCAVRVRRTWDDYTAAHKDRPIDGPSAAQTHQATWIADETAKCERRASALDVMTMMTKFRDQMCACKAGDKNCANAVQQEMTDYSKAHLENFTEHMSDEDMKAATRIGVEMAECMSKALIGP